MRLVIEQDTLPEITDDVLPWLRALPQEDQDVVVVARAVTE